MLDINHALRLAKRARRWAIPYRPSAAVLYVDEHPVAVAAPAARTSVLAELWAATPRADVERATAMMLLCEPEPSEVVEIRRWPQLRTVWLGCLDPQLYRAGCRALAKAGLEVRVLPHNPAIFAHFRPYFLASQLGRPSVMLKSACSLDGRTATRSGESQWITSVEARARGREMRAEVDAIVVGVETVLADDPQLTARIPETTDPLRVVVDSRGRTPADAQVIRTASTMPTVVMTTPLAPESWVKAVTAAGAQVDVGGAQEDGRVSIQGALARLFARGVRTAMIEGGATLAGAFVDARAVDRVAWFIAPMLLGGDAARPALGGRGVLRLSEGLRVVDPVFESVGGDVLVLGEVASELGA